MGVTLLYSAQAVGPVCRRVGAGEGFNVVRDHTPPTHHNGVLVRWGSASTSHTGDTELNSPQAVMLAKDKIRSRQALGPLSPTTWTTTRDVQFPCVVRPRRHHAGNRFHVCGSRQEFQTLLQTWRGSWYASTLIEKEAEFRVFVVRGRVVAISERFPSTEGQVAWNLAVGGRLVNVRSKNWNPSVVQAGIQGAEVLGLDWTAMDVGVERGGRPVVFEANTAPGLRNPWTISKITEAFKGLE